jgi:rhodanese-related sulfurtransferase
MGTNYPAKTMSFPAEDELEISPAAVAALRAAGEEFVLVDCREQDEWHVCRIEGAELLPLSHFAQTARRRFDDPARRVVIHCHHGMRSAQAAHFLRQCGMPLVWSMAGGIEAWSLGIDPDVPRY